VLAWLRENIHRPGSTWLPGELVERVTGEKLDARHFVAYLEEIKTGKQENLYDPRRMITSGPGFIPVKAIQ